MKCFQIFNSTIYLFFLCGFVGPVVAEAMFVNREEIPVYPIYRDPVSQLCGSNSILV